MLRSSHESLSFEAQPFPGRFLLAPPKNATKQEDPNEGGAVTPNEVNQICHQVESLSPSLNCTCGTTAKYPDTIAILCKGPHNYQQDLVFQNGKPLLEKTCAEFQHEENKKKEDLVCVTEYYYDTGKGFKSMMCEATINNERCGYCSPTMTTMKKDCSDGLSLRCLGYSMGSLCTNADGSKRLHLVKFGTVSSRNNGGGGGSSGGAVWFVVVVFVVIISKIVQAGSRDRPSSSTYQTVEMSSRR